MKKRLHISQVEPKTAENLAGAYMVDDHYHDCIKESARHQVDKGLGHWEYHTQYRSGSCVWRTPDNEKGAIVSREDMV